MLEGATPPVGACAVARAAPMLGDEPVPPLKVGRRQTVPRSSGDGPSPRMCSRTTKPFPRMSGDKSKIRLFPSPYYTFYAIRSHNLGMAAYGCILRPGAWDLPPDLVGNLPIRPVRPGEDQLPD